jgi:hypothetical protein
MREVCSHTTGHAEAVLVTFDPEVVTFEQLLEVFWAMHDPTQVNRQDRTWATSTAADLHALRGAAGGGAGLAESGRRPGSRPPDRDGDPAATTF